MAASTAPLSFLATKYNHPTGEEHKIVAFTGRSGLSPLRELPPGILSRAQLDYRRSYQKYQKRRLFGFATYELEDLEAFAPTYQWPSDRYPDGGVDVSFLTIPLHPILFRSNWCQPIWEHLPRYPRGDGIDDYWEGADDATWNALLPALKLATLVLQNCQSLLWWQAFLDGEYERIDDDLLPDDWKGDQLRRFRRQRNYFNQAGVQDRLASFTRAFKVKFHLASGWASFTSGMPTTNQAGNGKFLHGEAWYKEPPVDSINIRFAHENLEPLLQANLSGAERKLDIFRVAVTILHELCHAMWKHVCQSLPATCTEEPYFENESLSELGFSMETAVFGGRVEAVTEVQDYEAGVGLGLSCATLGSSTWFNWSNQNYTSRPFIPPKPADWSYDDWYPIPIGYFEDVWHPSFWHHARQFGDDTSHMGPKTLGTRYHEKGGATRVALAVSESRVPELQLISTGMNIERLASIDFENRRQLRTIRIKQAAVHDYGERHRTQDDIWAPGPFPNPAEPGALWQGSRNQVTEPAPVLNPICPRFIEIQNFLLANRAEGKLCLDIMTFEIPEFTFYRYIRRFLELQPDPDGFFITVGEWREFLRVCGRRGVLFRITSTLPLTHGITTILFLPPSPPPSSPTIYLPTPQYFFPQPPASEMTLFRNLSLHRNWTEQCPPDLDFYYLLAMCEMIVENWRRYRGYDGPGMGARMLRGLLDWEDLWGRLWRWGPNGLVRKRIDTFPTGSQSQDPHNSGSNILRIRGLASSGASAAADGSTFGVDGKRGADEQMGGDVKRLRAGEV